jgi:hypothetical protein
MARVIVGVLLLAWSGLVLGSTASVRKQMEVRMQVSGEVEVDARGKLVRYELDQREKVPEAVQKFLDRKIAEWQFEPTVPDGQAMAIRNRVGMLIVAKRIEGSDFQIELRGIAFHRPGEPGTTVESVSTTPPVYPRAAAMAGAAGTVYLVLKIGRDGNVADVMAEQVNLRMIATERTMDRWRAVLAENAVANARQWTFRPPQHGDLADDDSWTIRMPVAYTIGDTEVPYGRWEGYIPGPRQRAPWAAADDIAPDALAAGGLYQAGGSRSLHLLPPEPDGG